MTELAETERALAQTEEGALLLDVLAGRIEPPPVDSAKLSDRITRAMLEAETPEDALRAGATVSFEDGLLGKPIEVRDLVFRKSALKGDTPVFALIEGYDLSEGVELTITCSAIAVLRTLGVWKVKGWLPSTFKVTQAENKTADGYTMYQIEAV